MDPLAIPCASRLDTSDTNSKAMHVPEELAPWEILVTQKTYSFMGYTY